MQRFLDISRFLYTGGSQVCYTLKNLAQISLSMLNFYFLLSKSSLILYLAIIGWV